MIEFVSGDFFEYHADIRINTVNCVGVMGAGVALTFKNKFPDMFIDYYNACKRNEVKPGKPHVWQHNDLISSFTIINLPTKVHWKNPSEYEYIEKGLIWLRQYFCNKANLTVTMPALGCGHGGLDWEKVKVMIIKYLGDINLKILVFEPNSSTRTNKQVVYDNELEKHNIYKLLPSDKLYPTSLVGRSALEIYFRGNIELIRRKNIAVLTSSKSTDREMNAIVKFINEVPFNECVFLLGLSNSNETDLAKAILSKGFKAVFVIPYGILQLKLRKDLELLWDYKNIVVLSTTNPNQTWKNYESVNSLRLRLKLADITLINALNYEYFKQYTNEITINDKIFFINYWNNDIEFFNDIKAQKVGISPLTNKPNILPLLRSLNEA